jgi:hypothetical protein
VARPIPVSASVMRTTGEAIALLAALQGGLLLAQTLRRAVG